MPGTELWRSVHMRKFRLLNIAIVIKKKNAPIYALCFLNKCFRTIRYCTAYSIQGSSMWWCHHRTFWRVPIKGQSHPALSRTQRKHSTDCDQLHRNIERPLHLSRVTYHLLIVLQKARGSSGFQGWEKASPAQWRSELTSAASILSQTQTERMNESLKLCPNSWAQTQGQD